MAKVRIGFIGCGGIAHWHFRNLASVHDAEVVALCDPSEASIARAKREHPHLAALPVFSDYRKMLDTVEMDAVSINSLHTQHADQICDSFAKGLHVICEKPLATTVADCRRVVAARDAANKIGAIAYQRHVQADYRFIKQKLDSGAFGKPTYIAAYLAQGWKKGTAGTWRQDPALSGGGQINDSGSHVVDIMLHLTGLIPETVCAIMDNRGTPVDIDSSVSIRFQGGAIGNIAIVGDAPAWHEDFTLVCENGAFYYRSGKLSIVEGNGSRLEAVHLAGGSDVDRNFVDAILGRAEVAAPFDIGVKVIALTEAAWKSAAAGGAPTPVEL